MSQYHARQQKQKNSEKQEQQQPLLRRAWRNNFCEARSVACEVMEMKYKPVDAPVCVEQMGAKLRSGSSHFPGDSEKKEAQPQAYHQQTPKSWEILTETKQAAAAAR